MAKSDTATPPPRSRPDRVYRVVTAIVVLATALAWLVALGGCQGGGAAASTAPEARGPGAARESRPALDDAPPEQQRARVLASFPHDRTSYTQGLLWEPDALIESAGGYGDSLVRRWRLGGGARPVVEQRLGDAIFAEGIAAVGKTVIQLSWREGIAFYRDRGTLRETGRRSYDGEGWGLCYDGVRLIMSDGSDLLTERDPESFLEQRRVAVKAATAGGGRVAVADLNELECVEGSVYANIYQSDRIARIDRASGRVTAMIDASGLLTPAERDAGAEVLNGIAYNAQSGTFYLTGKRWPRLFEVVFEPATDGAATPAGRSRPTQPMSSKENSS